jgi:HK97 family phage portal protein
MAWWTRTAHNRGKGDLLFNDPDGWVIEQPQLRWLGSDQLALLTTQSSGGEGDSALDVAEPGNSFPAITRATTLICDSLASVRWQVYRGRTELLPSPRWVQDPALSRPDGRISEWTPTGRNPLGPVSFWSQVILSALWYGDAFVFVGSRSPDTGVPVPPLLLLHPLLVDVVGPGRTTAEKPTPGYWLNVPAESGQPEEWHKLEPAEVMHIPGMPPYWGGRGRGAITGHLKSWGEAVAQRNYSTGIFAAGIPAGYLKVTAPNLTPTQADDLREEWMKKHGTMPGQRDIAVLNAVTDFVAVQMDPETAQMGDARRQSTLDVANAFGVEPYMLGLPSDNSTYANIESRMRHFVQFTLLPWARRIEGALDSEFPQGTELRLDLDSLTRADTGNRIKYYEAGLSQGWLTKDEVRLAEGMPPLPPEEAEPVPAPPEAEPPVSIVPPPKPEPPPEEGAA